MRAQVRALRSAGVSGLVLDIDSPGGAVVGTRELADDIKALDIPTTAVVGSVCASAAYWVASACDEIVALSSSYVGSVGVYMLHADISKMLEEWGVTITLIESGKGKTDGSMFKALSDDAKARFQAETDTLLVAFAGAVAKNRNKRVETVTEKWGAHAYLAERAVELGMIDRIGGLEAVLEGMGRKKPASRRTSRRRRTERARVGGSSMKLKDLLDRKQALLAEIDALEANADENGNLSDADQASYEEKIAAVESVNKSTKLFSRRQNAELESIARADPQQVGQVTASHVAADPDEPAAIDTYGSMLSTPHMGGLGYDPRSLIYRGPETHNEVYRRSAAFGEFMSDVQRYATTKEMSDNLQKLNAAAPATEQVGTAGGFLVQQDVGAFVNDMMMTQSAFLSRARVIPLSPGSNGIRFQSVDSPSRKTGSRYGGVAAYWTGEAKKIRGKQLPGSQGSRVAAEQDRRAREAPRRVNGGRSCGGGFLHGRHPRGVDVPGRTVSL